MFDPATLAAYVIAAIALILAPGPAQALVIARSIHGGRRAGIMASLGLNVGTMFHTVAGGLGVTAILASSAMAFTMIKLLGAAYLLYLGVKMFMDKKPAAIAVVAPEKTGRRAFLESIVTGILNPKVAIFFLAFLPQFVDPSRGSVMLQFIILGAILACIGIFWDSVIASVVEVVGRQLLHNERFARWRQRVTASIFMALGVQLAFAQSK